MTSVLVVGGGLIGRRHAQVVRAEPGFDLAGVVDPNLSDADFRDLDAALAARAPDAAIVATPNATHRALAERLIAAGVPVLVEKPLSGTATDAKAIVEASHRAGVPVLVGHHRRHHSRYRHFERLIEDGAIGRPVGAQVTWALRKPDGYFSADPWRTGPEGGPVRINAAHEIDLLAALLGPVAKVSALASAPVRNLGVEEIAAATLLHEGGAVSSLLVSDVTPSPWHFEGASGENPNIAETGQDGLRLFGTQGSVGFPSLDLWRHDRNDEGWGDAIGCVAASERADMRGEGALRAQLHHLAEVARGKPPLVSAEAGLHVVEVCEAILRSARTLKAVSTGS